MICTLMLPLVANGCHYFSELACEIGTGAFICEMAIGAGGAVPEEGGARMGGGAELRLSLTPEPAWRVGSS